MQLQLATKSEAEVEAGYVCSCGCRPQVTYTRGADNQRHVCCCGGQFAVGKDAESSLELGEGAMAEVQEFETPWGEPLEAAWAAGSDERGSRH